MLCIQRTIYLRHVVATILYHTLVVCRYRDELVHCMRSCVFRDREISIIPLVAARSLRSLHSLRNLREPSTP